MSRTAYITERERKNYQRKVRRQREIHRIFILAGITFVLVLAFTLSYHALLAHANTGLQDISYKYYTSIQIQPGDTLWELADRYADSEHYDSHAQYMEEVIRMNHLSGERVYAGDYLILPYYSDEFIQ
ncbi:MAG: LysM peptidoglycan-binding domain-containing protein [Acetatifactor sp.]